MAVNLLKKWLGTLALFACAACHLVYAEGVAELTVRGGHNAVDLYVVAYKTSSGNASSSLEPGIHALVRGQDKATLLIKGQVLGASRGFNGVFALADLHRYTGRAESFAVVDGKMIVFSNKTKSNRQDSKIVLGSKQNPVVDILNRRNVPLALITNVNDVSMAQHNLAPQGELFLISLRQANPFGPGITIALMLKRPTSQDAAGVLETIGQPVVVDYDFYTNKELLQLMHDEARDKVLSPAHLLHYMQRLPDDDRILREWRSNIESVYKRVKKDRKEVAGSKKTAAQREAEAQRQATIPYYSMIQNRVVFDQLPHAMLSRNPLGIFQLTNPISTSGGIGSSLVIRNPQVDPDDTIKPNTQATTQGRVDYDEHTKAYRVYPIVSDVEENPAMIAVVDGRSKILFQGDYSDKYISVVDISTLLPADFRQIQAVHTKAPLEGTRIIRHYFFISHTTRDSGAQTDVILCEERDGVVKFERRLALNRRLMSTKELNARIVVKTDADDGIPTGAVLFDDVSSSEKVQRRRTKMENLTTPLLDINATRSSETVRQTYLNALQTLDLIEGQLEHRRYNPTGVKQSQTGFYYHRIPNPHNDPKIEINFVPAEILKPENDKRAKATLDSKTIRDKAGPDKPPMFVVSAYAYNPEPGKKLPENKFSILLYAGTGGTLEMTAGVTRVDIPGPIERLVGAKIITGRKSRSLNATLLLFFKAAKGKESRAKEKSGGVYAVNFDLTTGQNITANNRIQLVSQSWIEREEVRPDQIRHRLVWDTPGESYWILTPGKERHDRNFKVARFSLGGAEALYPNQPGRRIMLRHGEPADDDNYESLYRSMSRWIVVDTSDLEDSFPQQKSLWTAGEKSTDEKVKKGKEKILFPQFETFLEQRAQERGPSFHEVVLVEEAHKQTFLRTIVKQLLRKQGFWSLNNQNFTLFALDPKVGDKEMRDEIDKIAKHGAGRNLLYANLGDMLQAQNIEVERLATQKSNDTEDSEENNENNENGNDKDDDKADESEATSGRRGKTAVVIENGETATESDADGEGEEDGDDVSFKTSMMMVLASEGDHLPLKHFRSKTKTGNRVPMLIIATPAEWRALQNNYEDETNAGVFNSFEVNSQFLTSTWSVWNPDSGKATEEVVKASQAPISADEYHVFPNLEKILLEAANKNVPAKHRLVVVPEELKPLVRRLVLARWATDTKAVLGPWNHANFDLALFQVNQTNLSQELIAENFEAMRGALRSRRPVLMGDMSDILKAGRPLSVSGPTGSFSVRDPAMGKTASSGLADDDQANSSITSRQVPHLMWWLTTEGRKVQPQKTKSWDIKQDAPEQIPMMIFASEQELAQMRTDTEFEQRFVDIEKQFAIEHLEVPSEETRQKLIDELFNNSKIAGLGYTFDHKNYNDAEARRQLVGMMVNRVEHIARGLNQEPTNAFLKAYLELRRQLTEDSRLRQERRIDSFFFERLYRRVFNMPLSFEILTKDDPLLKLKDPERAAIGLQERGYEGPTELKRQVLETVTSQTKGADDGRPVPSSTILYGSTSTGKTFLFKKLIEYMGLKLYDFSKPNDDQASAFIINLGTLLEKEDPANPGRLSVDKALQHLENFLALPQGLRGFVLIDDAHKGSPEVRKRFLQFMQGFFEAPGGMLRVHRMNERKEIVDIPVRNLNLFMTLNPQPDREIRDKFVDEYKNDIDKEIIAALAGDGISVDESFVARWSTKLNLDRFPREAKLPTLVTRIRSAAQQEYSSRPRVMLVTPQVLDQFVSHFPNANAREFLSAATNGVLSLDNDLAPAPVYIVQPNIDPSETGGELHDKNFPRKDKINPSMLKDYLKKITVVRPVRPNEISSQLHLTSFMMDGFRTHVYNSLVTSAQRMPELAATRQMRTRDMAAFLMGLLDNLGDFESVPLKEVRMQPDELQTGMKPSQIAEYYEILAKQSEPLKSFFRFNFQSRTGANDVSLEQFLDSSYSPKKRGRLDVLAETSGKIEKILYELVAAYYRLPDVVGGWDLHDWGQRLTDNDQPIKEQFKKASEAIIHLYLSFGEQLYDSDLKEMAKDAGFGNVVLTDYDKVRLFAMCVDKAVTQLPWGRMTRFTMEAVTKSSNDLAWGLRQPLQHFYFKSVFSPLGTLTPELVTELAQSSRDYREYKERVKTGPLDHFTNNCDKMLLAEGDKK